MNSRTQTTVLIVLAALVGCLGTALYMQRPSGMAFAQDSVNANFMIGMIGSSARSFDVPIVLVDTRMQVLLVYQFNTASEKLKLIQARTYRYDRQLMEFPGGSSKVRPSVKEVQEYVTKHPPE